LHIAPQELDLTKTDRHDLVTGSKARVFCITFFFLAVAFTYLPWYLHSYRSFKLEDSGIFLYVGQRLLHGDLLYRDIADNKPPLIYWLNALGLLLGHGSPGDVFALCLASGILTLVILYLGLKHHVPWPLFIIAGCWTQLAFLECAKHPNYTEAFGLPLVALAGVLFVRELLNPGTVAWYAPAQGAIAVLLFSLRPNNVGITVIYFCYLLLGLRKPGRLRQLYSFAIAAIAVYGLMLVPLALQGIVPDYVTNVFRLAGPYTGGTRMLARVHALWEGFVLLGASPLVYFPLACGATVILAQRRSRHARVVLWLGLWLVLEIVMSATSGYHWEHYYVLWILPLTLITMLAGSDLSARGLDPRLPVVLALSLILVLLNQAAIKAYPAWAYPEPEDPAIKLARTYVQQGDRLTTWGYFDHDLWFDLDHRPGTRWFHEGAYTNRKIYQALVPSFLSDLEQNRPRVVIERRSAVPLFAPPDPDEPLNFAFPPEYFQAWDDTAIMRRKAALAEHYRPVVEESGVVVYLRRE
jgi:hypothetical protein